MNILLPTDFSSNAETARDYAINLLSKGEDKLFIMHAYDLPSPDRSISTSLVEVMRENAEEHMNNFLASPSLKDVKIEGTVMMGNPIRLTKEMAEKKDIDIIVMGTKGASGLEEFLIGSNASAVIHAVEIPVLIIPPSATYQSIKKMVLASDLDPRVGERPFVRLRQIAEISNAEIDILHIRNGKEGKADKQFMEEMLGDMPHSYHSLNSENKEEAILEYCRENNADVICTIARKYNFFEAIFHKSLTSKLAYHSSLPLLALHQE